MKKFAALVLALLMLTSCALAAEYTYNPEKPYDGVMTGWFNNVAITAGEEEQVNPTGSHLRGQPARIGGSRVLRQPVHQLRGEASGARMRLPQLARAGQYVQVWQVGREPGQGKRRTHPGAGHCAER